MEKKVEALVQDRLVGLQERSEVGKDRGEAMEERTVRL
jgi:hypothetical protein